MDFKLISYWLVSITTLAFCLFIPWNDSSLVSSEPLNITNMLKVEPRYFYYNNDKYHAKISGELKLNIKTDSLKDQLLQYNTIVISELDIDLNTDISLNWQVDEQIHQIPLINSSNSITPFSFNVTSIDQITNLHFLIKPNFEMGSQTYLGREVSFKSIYFDTLDQQNILAKQLSQWLNFNPIKFNSINGYSDASQMNLKGLILRLIIWLIISILLYRMFAVSGAQLIINLTIAWLLLFLPFGINFVRQHEQIQQAYANGSSILNYQDQEAYNLAQSIQAYLKSHPSWSQNEQKYIILGSQDFKHLRLFHHLMDLNVALSNSNQISAGNNLDKHIYILTNKLLRHCDNPTNLEFIKAEFEILEIEQSACLVRMK